MTDGWAEISIFSGAVGAPAERSELCDICDDPAQRAIPAVRLRPVTLFKCQVAQNFAKRLLSAIRCDNMTLTIFDKVGCYHGKGGNKNGKCVYTN